MLNFNEIIELKKYLKEYNNIIIHLHDTCGGQYFTIENGDNDTEKVITENLLNKNQKAVFSEDRQSFTIV